MKSTAFLIMGLALALLPRPRAEHYEYTATWSRCRRPDEWRRVPDCPQDNATTLNLEFCEIERLTLKDFNQTALPKLKKISLDYNNIEYINPAVFKPVSHVRKLSIQHNKLTKVPVFGLLSLFPRLQFLFLAQNEINGITDERTFSACVRLRYLYLQRNQIAFLHPGVFKPLVKLYRIDLQHNKLTFISDSMFQVRSLKYIYLTRNLIEYVSPHAFGGELRELRLNRNRLTYLPANMTSELQAAGARLSEFLFHDNPWQCACLLQHLADVKRAGVSEYGGDVYNYMSRRPVCVLQGPACQRSTSAPAGDRTAALQVSDRRRNIIPTPGGCIAKAAPKGC